MGTKMQKLQKAEKHTSRRVSASVHAKKSHQVQPFNHLSYTNVKNESAQFNILYLLWLELKRRQRCGVPLRRLTGLLFVGFNELRKRSRANELVTLGVEAILLSTQRL